ncbi:hypothetical protein GCM10027168_36780 [Streptomyces capparidis]
MTALPLVASDLDRTLIYSTGALALDMPDELAPTLLCVEVYQRKPLSFMTERAAALLRELAGAAVFVPATTRTREQYRRVRLPGPVPPYAICANGGHLLVDGRTDYDWRAAVQERLAASCAPLAEVRAHLAAVADPAWLLKNRVAEDLFAYLVVERSALPAAWLADLTGWAGERNWTVSLQGRKVYAVPGPLTKTAALEEVVRRTGATTVLSAGDSLLDAELLRAADEAWRPAHGELADTGWTAPGVTALPEAGVAAGEEILRRMLARARSTAGAAPAGAAPTAEAALP